MSFRKSPVIKGEIYHVFNRSIAQQPIFLNFKDYQRALEVFKFYQFDKPSLRFSFYNRLTTAQKNDFLLGFSTQNRIVEILCFCLMSNHVHFLLKNLTEDGITKFMGKFQNSYAKYFNIRQRRVGSLFQQNFKAVRIETEEQLIHVSRYIHLNPVTAYTIEATQLKDYRWSSYPEYLKRNSDFLSLDLILSYFKNSVDYEKFVMDQAAYQRELDRIKHLIIDFA